MRSGPPSSPTTTTTTITYFPPHLHPPHAVPQHPHTHNTFITPLHNNSNTHPRHSPAEDTHAALCSWN
ncbi:hypothetical protein E2C01_017101 [Portunus trituberculatus]|uniref:Uncharacterized protein n=1 Tax=Portunus trituberculatus TaxID=210409 RepID=A0A5B7DR02_PORTR|nr:hypothetical protein [Portunus trituberculatus]